MGFLDLLANGLHNYRGITQTENTTIVLYQYHRFT